MRSILYFLSIVILLTSIRVHEAGAQKIEQIRIDGLERILNSRENKLLVVNFWATWCPPCVMELPDFEKVAGEFDRSKVRFILVSLDFPSQIETQLKPFLEKNKITLDVTVMMDTDYNSWIDKVDPQWQGNIPSTLFLNNQRKSRYFHSGELDESGLRKLINQFI
jgi:thiol-disulfide isomerase/thioredoxin